MNDTQQNEVKVNLLPTKTPTNVSRDPAVIYKKSKASTMIDIVIVIYNQYKLNAAQYYSRLH